MTKKTINEKLKLLQDEILAKIKNFEEKENYSFTGIVFIPNDKVTHYSKTTWNMTSYGKLEYD